VLGRPQYMGNIEAALYTRVAEEQGPAIRDRMLDDAEAMRLYHNAFYGFRDGIPRRDMPDWEDLFYQYMYLEYGIDWNEVYDWATYRRLYGPGRQK
jgi:hypothetical protein